MKYLSYTTEKVEVSDGIWLACTTDMKIRQFFIKLTKRGIDLPMVSSRKLGWAKQHITQWTNDDKGMRETMKRSVRKRCRQ